jgi:hypothetical protein
MYIVDHKFTKNGEDITTYASEILNYARGNRNEKLPDQEGYIGVTTTISEDKSSFTISVYWESNDLRIAANRILDDTVGTNTALTEYCNSAGISYTKENKEIT